MLYPLCSLSHSSSGLPGGLSTLWVSQEWVLGFILLSALFAVVSTSVSASNRHCYIPSQCLLVNFTAPFSNFRSLMSSSFTFVFFFNNNSISVIYFPLSITLTAQSFIWIDIFISWPFIIVWIFWLRLIMGIFLNFQVVNTFLVILSFFWIITNILALFFFCLWIFLSFLCSQVHHQFL